MIGNYLKILFRNLLKHPGYALSNISSLAVGMTTCMLILLFVRYEFNWNTSNKNYDRVYRVQQKVLFKDDFSIYGQTGYQVGKELKKQIPEIEYETTTNDIGNDYLSSSYELTFNEENGFYADNNLFKIFTYEFLKGNPANALTEPFSVVLTEKLAEKYFPGQDAMGKLLKSSKSKSLKVTGIVKDLPFNSDFRPDYIVSMPTYLEVAEWKGFLNIENIGAAMFYTFVTLKPNASLKEVNDKIFNFQDQYVPDNYKKFYLKPLSELHLTAYEETDMEVALFYIGAFAIFVLILACINYINLSTANSFLRKKEIGVRKVVGASRFSLFSQFIGEALVIASISMVLAFLLAEFILPYFNLIVERPITINFINDYKFFLVMVAVFVVTGFLSGIYPAMYLSGFKPVQVIKGDVSILKKNRKGSSKSFLRKALVTAQFCISINLLICTIYVVNQVHYMNTKDLGFNKKNILMCRVYGPPKQGSFETLRNRLLNNSNIVDASLSTNAPFHGSWGREINWEGAALNEKMNVRFNKISYGYIDTYKMKMALGRNFSRQFSTDKQACIINETLWKSLGWNDPIGKRIDNNEYTIIGVVKDFHPYSVHVKIPPFYMILNSGDVDDGNRYSVRIKPGDNQKTIASVRNTFREFFPDAIVEVTDFDSDWDVGTKGVWAMVEKIFIGFAIIAILIAANGLFGMISFASQRRLKEIGVRKVFGANNPQLYLLMAKEFAVILLFAMLVVYPAGYFVSHTTPGAYKYQMGFIDYFFGVGIMLITAVAATMYHTTKAILTNPVETLRYE